jgi:hypothetical protein
MVVLLALGPVGTVNRDQRLSRTPCLHKLQVASRAEAVALARDAGLGEVR